MWLQATLYKHSRLIIIATLALVAIFMGYPQQALAASTYTEDSLSVRTEKWVLARAVTKCLNDARPGLYLADNSKSKLWTKENATIGGYAEKLADPGGNNDEVAQCQKVWDTAIDKFGWDNDDTLCKIGYTKVNLPSGTKCSESPIKQWKSIDSSHDDLWNKLVRKDYLDGKNLTDNTVLTRGMKYIVFYNEFLLKCGDDNGGGLKPYPLDTKPTTDNNKLYKIYWPANDGEHPTAQQYIYVSGDAEKDWKTRISGYGSIKKGDVMTCDDLAFQMNSHYRDYDAEFEADVASNKDPASLSTSGKDDPREGSCEERNGSLGWFGCPLLNTLDGIVDFLDKTVRSLLLVQIDKVQEDDGNGNGLKNSWMIFRNIAYLVLIPIMLVMVIGTAVGIGPFDNYTVKKALPRMLASVIFIAISYNLTVFFVKMTNFLGAGVFNLINLAAPGGAATSLGSILGAGTEGTLQGAGFATLAAGAAFSTLGDRNPIWGLLGSFALVTIVGLLIGFVVLVIRQVLLLVIIVLAPLAILSWIFPGNDKLWNIWKTTFIALLMMFPLIMILLAFGRFFAATSLEIFFAPVNTLVALVAYIAPFFFIPATFKYGLGAFGMIAGKLNDTSRGLFDRQRKYRQGKYAQGRKDFLSGNSRSRMVRGLGERAGVGIHGRFGFGARGQAARAGLSRGLRQEGLKDANNVAFAQSDDIGNAIVGLSGGSDAGAVQASHDLMNGWIREKRRNGEAVDMAEMENKRRAGLSAARGHGISRANAEAASVLMMQNKARAVAGGDWGTIQRGVNRLHGSNTTAANQASQDMRYTAMEAGRTDFASTGGMNTPDMNESSDNFGQLDNKSVIAGFSRAGAAKTAAGYKGSVETVGSALSDQFNGGSLDESIDAAAGLIALRNAENAGTPEDNKVAIHNALTDAGVDTSSSKSIDQQFGELMAIKAGAVPPPPPPRMAALAPGATSTDLKNARKAHDLAMVQYSQRPDVVAYETAVKDFTNGLRTRSALYDQQVPVSER